MGNRGDDFQGKMHVYERMWFVFDHKCDDVTILRNE